MRGIYVVYAAQTIMSSKHGHLRLQCNDWWRWCLEVHHTARSDKKRCNTRNKAYLVFYAYRMHTMTGYTPLKSDRRRRKHSHLFSTVKPE